MPRVNTSRSYIKIEDTAVNSVAASLLKFFKYTRGALHPPSTYSNVQPRLKHGVVLSSFESFSPPLR